MAVLWSQVVDDNHYEVRSAGASLRLYRNGVNHSQWNPQRPLGGSIWDLISLPALHRQEGSLQNALILGFGAGTVARQLRDLAGIQQITGLELDPIHLSIADGFFDCADACELVAGDAVEWVEDHAGNQTYDLIIDDLYAEEDGLPVRCAPLDADWCQKLIGMLSPQGLLVFNLIEPEKVPLLPLLKEPALRKQLPHSIMYQLNGYENRVLAISAHPFKKPDLEASLQRICRRFPRCYGVGRRYHSSTP